VRSVYREEALGCFRSVLSARASYAVHQEGHQEDGAVYIIVKVVEAIPSLPGLEACAAARSMQPRMVLLD
jgi:hypothetical protein